MPKRMASRSIGKPVDADIMAGAILLKLRTEAGLSRQILATASDRTPHQIRKYETGQNRMTPGVMISFAALLGVSPCAFLEFDTTKTIDDLELPYKNRIRARIIRVMDKINNPLLEDAVLKFLKNIEDIKHTLKGLE